MSPEEMHYELCFIILERLLCAVGQRLRWALKMQPASLARATSPYRRFQG